MPQITAHINKKHKSLLDHNTDLDTSAEDDIQMEEDRQDHVRGRRHVVIFSRLSLYPFVGTFTVQAMLSSNQKD